MISSRFDVSAKNEVHQADLLFCDMILFAELTKHKYVLTSIDVGTRYREPLSSKDSKDVGKAFENKIYICIANI